MRSGESGPEMSEMDLAGGPGLACDPVFRGGTLCPGLTAADGLALNKSGRRMNQLASYFSLF